ncbi:MAG: trigger factor [Lachnospiraceae bacterium]
MKKIIMALVVLVLLTGLIMGTKVLNIPGEKGTETTSDGSANDPAPPKVSISDLNVLDYVTLGDYMNVEVTVDYADITDKEVKDYANKVAAQYPDYKKTSKTDVQDGDTVNIDYKGLIDGEAFEGGTDKAFNLKIGSGSFIDGFESGLIGKKVGSDISLNLTFPEDYQSKELAGKEVVFEVKINSIMEPVIYKVDEFTDKYVNKNFGFDTVKEFLEDVRSSLEKDNQNTKDSNTRQAIVDAVLEVCKVKMPEGLLDSKIADYKEKYIKMVEGYGYKFEDFLQSNYQMTEKEFMEQIATSMNESVKQELVFSAIAEKEQIEVDKEAYAEYEKSFISYYGYADAKALYKDYPREDLERNYKCDQVIQMLLDKIKITYA